MTKRLYLNDSYRTHFKGKVAELKGTHVRLEETYFYPTAGGQPNDTGRIADVNVVDVKEEHEAIWHILDQTPSFALGDEVECVIDWERRFQMMQQHSGQHLLSALLETHFGIETLSVHIGNQSTIDLSGKFEGRAQFEMLEKIFIDAVFKCRPVTVHYEPLPESEKKKIGQLRVVTIEGFDRNPCCGTHVRNTGEIGPLLIQSVCKNREGWRLTYLIGLRAVVRMQELEQAFRVMGESIRGSLDQMPALAQALVDKNKALKKERDALAGEVAALRFEKLMQTVPKETIADVKLFALDPEEFKYEESYARLAASVPNVVVVATETKQLPPYRIAIGSSCKLVNCGAIFKKLSGEWRGKGGGGAAYVCGSVQTKPEMERLLLEVKAHTLHQ